VDFIEPDFIATVMDCGPQRLREFVFGSSVI
jgi:hypothetical protein